MYFRVIRALARPIGQYTCAVLRNVRPFVCVERSPMPVALSLPYMRAYGPAFSSVFGEGGGVRGVV